MCMKLTDKGILTGLFDSNGREIKSGDNVRYIYNAGVLKTKNEKGEDVYVSCYPYDTIIQKEHITKMEFKIDKTHSGFFLDLPTGICSSMFINTLKYFVVD